MPKPKSDDEDLLFKRIRRELVDEFDEELEMEREDWEATKPGALPTPAARDAAHAERQRYFMELYRLQSVR